MKSSQPENSLTALMWVDRMARWCILTVRCPHFETALVQGPAHLKIRGRTLWLTMKRNTNGSSQVDVGSVFTIQ